MELEGIIRLRMKKYNITIGGRGNTAEMTFDSIIENGNMDKVMNELVDIYKDFDKNNGTNLMEGFVLNLIHGAHKMY